METTCESISVFSSSNLGTRGVGSFTRPLIGTDRHEPKSHSNFVQARGILLFACEDLCKVCVSARVLRSALVCVIRKSLMA